MRLRVFLAGAAISLPLSFAAWGGATSAGATVHLAAKAFTCSGGSVAMGPRSIEPIPPGTYSNVVITSTGTCAVGGVVTVLGNLTVAPGGALGVIVASASLTVGGSVTVGSGAAAFIGCEPNFDPCHDNANGTSHVTIKGSLDTDQALTVVLHASTVEGDVTYSGGGGGVGCPNEGPGTGTIPGSTPAVKLLNAVGSPPYFDSEDNTVGGNMWITNLRSCWFGALRNTVGDFGGSLVVENNVMADPDAGEVLANPIGGNLICSGENPAPQFGDSRLTPNVVSGTAVGQCSFSVLKPNPAAVSGRGGKPAGSLEHISIPNKKPQGYTFGAGDGGVFNFRTKYYGSAVGVSETKSWVGIATAPGPNGYWLANSDGAVASYGPNAVGWGDASRLKLASPVVGIAASPWGDGYYLAAADGGVFAYGPGSHFYGSAGAIHLAKPIVGVAAVAAGNGYYLVATDGGVFAYGPGAAFHGSLGNIKLKAPIVGMTVDPVTGGYWLVGADGGVFSFDAPFFGSTGNIKLNQPVVGIVAAPTGTGYYLIAKDGGVFAFGKGARYQGGTGGIKLNQPIVGMGLG